MFHQEQLLRKIYYDLKTGFQGVQKLYSKAKKMDQSIERKDVDEFIKQQYHAGFTIHMELKTGRSNKLTADIFLVSHGSAQIQANS